MSVLINKDTKVLVGEVTDTSLEEPFAHEKLSVVLAMYKSSNHAEAVDMAESDWFYIADCDDTIKPYTLEFFNDKANLICIGDGQNKRAFLGTYNNQYKEILEETLSLIEN